MAKICNKTAVITNLSRLYFSCCRCSDWVSGIMKLPNESESYFCLRFVEMDEIFFNSKNVSSVKFTYISVMERAIEKRLWLIMHQILPEV